MPALRVDWQKIKADTEANGFVINEPFVFVLPHVGRHLLMSIIDILKYEATYRIEGYDYSDYDELQAIVEMTHYGLMEGEKVGEISEAIVYMADKLAENFPQFAPVTSEENMAVNVTQTVNCGCGGAGGTVSNVVDDSAPPDGYTIPPIVPPVPIDTVQNVDKCNRATYLVVSFRNAVLTLSQGAEGSFTAFSDWFDGIIGWLVGYVPLSYDVYLKIKSWSVAGEFTNTDNFLSAFDPNFDAMVCSLYSSATPEAGKVALRQMLETFVLDSVSPAMKLAILSVFENIPFDLMYDASADVVLPPGYVGRECCGSIPVDNVQDVWEYQITGITSPYGTCGTSQLTETVNQASAVDVAMSLNKDSQYGGYDAKIFRDTPIGDATNFSFEFNQSGNMKQWTLYFRNGMGTSIHSVVIPQQAYTFASVNLSAFDKTAVSRIEFVRQSDVYAESCPRTFAIDFTITTDSEDWLVY